MHQKKGGLFEFGPYRLETAERRLWRNRTELVQLPPKVFDLLVLLVENRGRLLDKSFILQSLWPGTFVEEANLSVNVSLLRKVLGDGAGATYIETVPKRGYRFVADVSEIVPEQEQAATVTAVEVGPKPAEIEPAIWVQTPVPQTKTRRWRIWVGIGALVLAIVASRIMWDRILGQTANFHSIAVLPFLPLDDDPARNYLGLGMAEAVATRLTTLPQITVRPTSAVAKYSNRDRDPVAAARQLQVDAVVVGGIQQYEKRIRVTVQLYRAKDGASIWADQFDDYFTNIFAVQDSISERVAGALKLKLTEAERQHMIKRATESTEAYQLYLQGQYLATKRFGESGRKAIEYYEKAVEKDPDFATAYAALAYSYVLQAGEGREDVLRNKGRMAAMKAISLDSQLADAHVALGDVLMRLDWDWTGADRAFNRAIAINPHLASAHAEKSTLLTAFGRHDEAIREMETACRLDPSSAILLSDLAWTLHFARRYEDALRESRKAVTLDPWSYTPQRQLTKALLLLSRLDEGQAEGKKTLDIAGGHNRRVLIELATVWAAQGKKAEARGAIEEVNRGEWKEPLPHYEIAVLHSALGDKSAALDSLRTAVELRLTRVVWMRTDPELDSLHAEPQFQELLKTMRLTP
jgi:DNA-binding winged helix-turn-helix (wHTH) protein/TolB-like protein/Flp pilus assembly protein TadD